MTMQLGAALVLGVALYLGCGHPLLWAPEGPFSVLWNGPSAHYRARFGVHLPLEALGISQLCPVFPWPEYRHFYRNQLGFFPYFGPRGTAHNGDIPQAASLTTTQHGLLTRSTIAWDLALLAWQCWIGKNGVHTGLGTGTAAEPSRKPQRLEHSGNSPTWALRSSFTRPVPALNKQPIH